MKITLRRAAQLQSEITRAMSDISLQASVAVEPNPVIPAKTVYTQNFQRFSQSYLTWTDLNRICTQIRSAVGEANAQLGVARLLAEDAGAKLHQNVLTNLVAAGKAVYPGDQAWEAVYQRSLEKQNTEANSYYYKDPTMSLLDENTVQKLKEELATVRRRRNEISDQLLGINTNNTIDINEQDWARLQDLGLV
jgi:hypothetical protein